MIYVVLGMHKSGTTLVSKILHESEVNMGEFDPTVTYDQGNQYERKAFKEANIAMLNCEGTHSSKVTNTLPLEYENEEIKNSLELQISQLNNEFENWGFKDPRTCLTYHYWHKILPQHKVIVVFRSPTEVWNHYQKYIPKIKVFSRFMAGLRGLTAWYVYNKNILEILNHGKTDYISFEYSDFMRKEDSLKVLSEFVNVPLVDCRDKKLFRAAKTAGIVFSIVCMLNKRKRNYFELYERLCALKANNGI